MIQTEVQDLKANPDRNAQGAVVEARVEKGLGTVATTLIQKGTLRVGDNFAAGASYGRVRALIASDGKTRVKKRLDRVYTCQCCWFRGHTLCWGSSCGCCLMMNK